MFAFIGVMIKRKDVFYKYCFINKFLYEEVIQLY